MTKLISPQGTATTVADSQVAVLVRLGWKQPGVKQEPEKKPAAKRGRASKSE